MTPVLLLLLSMSRRRRRKGSPLTWGSVPRLGSQWVPGPSAASLAEREIELE